MKTVASIINFIRSRDLNHGQLIARFFKEFSVILYSVLDKDVIYHNEVRWFYKSKVLTKCFRLREEIMLVFFTSRAMPARFCK